MRFVSAPQGAVLSLSQLLLLCKRSARIASARQRPQLRTGGPGAGGGPSPGRPSGWGRGRACVGLSSPLGLWPTRWCFAQVHLQTDSL